jgi:uncharacterized membrane protein
MTFSEFIERIGQGVDGAGVGVIVLGLALATTRFLVRVRRGMPTAYQAYREGLGRTLLLGLEFLVAADIIRTVAITPTFRSVGILAIIVAIRTFLSWALELELSGHWPWQRRDSRPREGASAGADEVHAK